MKLRITILILALPLVLVGCPEEDTTGTTDGATTEATDDATTGGTDDATTGGTEDATTGGTEDATTGADGDATGGDDAGGTGDDPTCAAYCTAISASCTADNAQYGDEQACNAYCEGAGAIPVGAVDDTAVNSVGCRTYHADVASQAGNAELHCPHAGPSGGDACGTYCENYCHLAMTNCTGGAALYDDNAACMTACADISTDGHFSDKGHDNIQCRIYHLGVAGSDIEGGSDVTHCPHGAVDGGGVCVAQAPTCGDYCAGVTAACTGDNVQYGSEADCVAYCETWGQLDPGTADDTAGNTIGCRTYHASVASESADNAVIHCPHAGPHGGDVCGSWCENYCDLAGNNCSGEQELFADKGVCMAACEGFPADGAGGDSDGDSVQCRIYHLGVAGSDLAGGSDATHCPHGAVDGGEVCVDAPATCDSYCALVMTNCQEGNQQYGTTEACVAYCETWSQMPQGDVGATSGNSIECRNYHAGVAGGSAAEAATHCAHAGPSGGDVCGSWCANYCDLATQNCTGDNKVFDNSDDCALACAKFAADGDVNAVDGDSVQCRIYHLGVAGSDLAGGSDATHCKHGAIDGGGVCEEPPACAEYCDAVMASCTGGNAQYDDLADCTLHCSTLYKLPGGSSADTSGNSLGCRIYHAGVAGGGANEAALHCAHAGASGGGVCGSWCENYCDLAANNCAGDNALYDNKDACMASCGGLVDTDEAGATSGDSVQCRIYHLGVGGLDSDAAKAHCPHAAMFSKDGVCFDDTPSCEVYCKATQNACGDDGGANSQYADMAACMGYCATFGALPLGGVDATDGNSVGCRTYHARVATTTDAGAHCGHAGPSGGNVCGSWCTNYCHLASQNCSTDPNALYSDDDDCITKCPAFSKTGQPGDTAGDSVQCRIYHLGVAGDVDAGGPGTHCAHGGQDGGGVCVGEVFLPGESCDNPIAIDTVPFSDSRDTTVYANDLTGGCDLEVGAASADVVYAFTAPQTATYTVTVTTEYDPALYLLGDCSAGDSCTDLSDVVGVGETETLTLSATQGTTYTIVVDGWGNKENKAGNYTLSIAAPCFPSCDGKACGGDGCGGECGPGCDEGDLCSDTGQCVGPESIQGNTCKNPIPIDGLTVSGDNSTGFTNVISGQEACPGGIGEEVGEALAPDVVYSFKAAKSGLHTVAFNGSGADHPTLITVATACDDFSSQCLGTSIDLFSGGTVEAELVAETTYLIIVDGVYADDAGAFELVITEPEVMMAAPTWDSGVSDIFKNSCGPCHTAGSSGGHQIGSGDYAEAAKAAVPPPAECKDLTVGECAVIRVMNGSMPTNGTVVSAEDKATLQAWIDGGMLEK